MATDRDNPELSQPIIHSENVTDVPTTIDLSEVDGNVSIKLGSFTTLLFAPITEATPEVIRNQAGDHRFVLLRDMSKIVSAGTHAVDVRFMFVYPDTVIDLGRTEPTNETFAFSADVSRQHARIKVGADGKTLTVFDRNSKNGTTVSWQEK